MNKTVDEYDIIKYSPQLHRVGSRALLALSAFVAAFGGVLLVATSAGASPSVTNPKLTTTATPSSSPSSTPDPSPTPTPSLSPSSVAVTPPAPGTTFTVTTTKTVIIVKTVKSLVSAPAPALPATSSDSATSEPTVPAATFDSVPSQIAIPSGGGENTLLPWGIGVAAITIGGLVIAGASGFVRRRRQYQGVHAAAEDDEETQSIPKYSVSDYDPGENRDDWKDPSDADTKPINTTEQQH